MTTAGMHDNGGAYRHGQPNLQREAAVERAAA